MTKMSKENWGAGDPYELYVGRRTKTATIRVTRFLQLGQTSLRLIRRRAGIFFYDLQIKSRIVRFVELLLFRTAHVTGLTVLDLPNSTKLTDPLKMHQLR